MNEQFDENSGALRKREEPGARRPIRVELLTAAGTQPNLHSNGHSAPGKRIAAGAGAVTAPAKAGTSQFSAAT